MSQACSLRQTAFCAVVLVLLLGKAVLAGSVSYPALGNIELEQGTIEMWLIPQFDPVEGELLERQYWGFNLFEVRQDEENYLSLIWRIYKGRSGPFARHQQEGIKLPVNWHVVQEWKQDEPHHVAYCWDGGVDWWIIDGQKMEKQASQHGALDLRLHETLQIVLGSSAMKGRFIIDDLRISSVPRKAEEVGYHFPGQLQPDFWTLLLDTFEVPGESGDLQETSPAIMTPSAEGQVGGRVGENTELVDGVSGKGLRF